ncbi:MAG: RimK family alpha-L-glutamate ligase [Clostridia bacterium]|nr:RimK family alpha-L-glutamate ligase [Clostridia bacterium]
MSKLAIATNYSYSTDVTKRQVLSFHNACKERNIDLVEITNSIPWSPNGTSCLPDKCIYLDKDICFATELERQGIRVYNCASAIELADNKIKTQLALCDMLAFPKTLIAPKRYFGYPSDAELDTVEQKIGYPVVVKEAYGSLGKQVYIANNRQELAQITQKIGSQPHLYQTNVAESAGKSLRVFIVGDKVIGAARYHNTSSFKSNLEEGGQIKFAHPSTAHRNAAIAAAKRIGLDFCAVDFFDTEKPLVIEVNSNAYFRGLEAGGVDVASEIIDYIMTK